MYVFEVGFCFEVTYFIAYIPVGAPSGSLRSCKNIPDVFVMSMDGRYAANAGAIGGHCVQVGHGLNFRQKNTRTSMRTGYLFVLKPGSDLLSHGNSHTIIGAELFHC